MQFKCVNKKIAAFSLIEISIVLIIIGVLTAAVLRGYSLLDDGKATATGAQLQKFVFATHQYRDRYGALPGDDPKAGRFGSDVQNGNGDGVIQESEQGPVWLHMQKAGYIDAADQPTSKFGGVISLYHGQIAGRNGLYLVLGQKVSNNQLDGALLTPKQAQLIKNSFDDPNATATSGKVIVQNGRGKTGCVSGDRIDLSNTSSVCTLYVSID